MKERGRRECTSEKERARNQRRASFRFALRRRRRHRHRRKSIALASCSLFPHLLDIHRCSCSLRPRKCLRKTSSGEAGGRSGKQRGEEDLKEERERAVFLSLALSVDAFASLQRLSAQQQQQGGRPPVALVTLGERDEGALHSLTLERREEMRGERERKAKENREKEKIDFQNRSSFSESCEK